MYSLGCFYHASSHGLPQDYTKALELWHRAAELGYAAAYTNIGVFYNCGIGVEIDEKKANHCWELAAIQGSVMARYNLGNNERKAGNFDRAVKHYMIAAQDGKADSLKKIEQFYLNGHATKNVYTAALRSYQEYLIEIKSRQRDEAVTLNNQFRYY